MIKTIIGLFVRITLVKRLLDDRRAGRWDVDAARRRLEEEKKDD